MRHGRDLAETLNKESSCQGQDNEPKGVCPMQLDRGPAEALAELLTKTLA